MYFLSSVLQTEIKVMLRKKEGSDLQKKLKIYNYCGPSSPQNYLSHAISQNSKNVCRMFNLLLAVDAVEK